MRLVADIGGTNARIGLCENGEIVPETIQSYANDHWPHFYEMLAGYLEGQSTAQVREMVIAVAGPVRGARAELTNRSWIIESAQLEKAFGIRQATLLNDLTALGHAVSVLTPKSLQSLYRGQSQNPQVGQSLVVGVGTGFNASAIIKTKGSVNCLSAEAGHISMPLSISKGLEKNGVQVDRFPTVESLFSGRGFSAYCQIVSNDNKLQGVDAIATYGQSDATFATSAVDQYAALFGQLLRELCLVYMPDSGIYLAGSVARAVTAKAAGHCTEVFARHCDIRDVQPSDLFTILDDHAALNGCTAFVQTS
ncbi:glucokinase [Octadecabacter ascidiaceicola]|uniref:Glucokinase n=1 Tax=Octadecabacter ascidiaceicola TaxID=1655543 RepID=A0A238JSX2_9RHOB|nr:ROK family protein [Octadecabacter ascidiaceicola]SMX32846.1 Glucokinase [Octadecabacter ascidiaceicola]